jgi:hypothetical protein
MPKRLPSGAGLFRQREHRGRVFFVRQNRSRFIAGLRSEYKQFRGAAAGAPQPEGFGMNQKLAALLPESL